MKNALYVFVFCLLSLTGMAQKHKKAKKLTDFSITQTKIVKQKGTQLVVKQVISDARCPVGVDCFWAGEAQVLVSIFQNKKWIDEEILTFSPKKIEENKAWLSKILAIPITKIKSIQLVPYPKDSTKIDPKTYTIKVEINK